MARAYRGPYARQSGYHVPYATAAVWGTGIDDIHSYYGEGPPIRVQGRHGTIGSSPVATAGPRDREYQEPGDTSGLDPPQELLWGIPGGDPNDYSPDSFGQGADAPLSHRDVAPAEYQYMDGRPGWNVPPEQERNRFRSGMPSWGTGGAMFRAIRGGAARYRLYPRAVDSDEWKGSYEPISAEQPNSFPTETVSEGWLNKVTSFTAYAVPSDPSQYEVQTSMRQRFGTRDNNRAQARGTDDARSKIASRVEAMVAKVYSEGERNYDMFPYQIDQIERPFRFRTAGVGRADWMVTNEFSPMMPWQRTPPPDPAMGVPEVFSEDYGYTGEDSMYYG